MGRIARILSFMRVERKGAKLSDVKFNPGGNPNITAEHYADPGDDSFPLTTDYVALTERSGAGQEFTSGYLDPINEPKALEGDKRIYGRDASTGLVVVEVWLKNDGTALVSNDNGSVTLRPDGGTVVTTPLSTFDCDADGSIAGVNGSGSFELEAAGDFVVNGVTIDTGGNIDSPATITAPNVSGTASVKAATKELAGHDHAITGGSSAPGPTGPNN